MAYTTINFKTKKALKEHVKNWVERWCNAGGFEDKAVTAYQPCLGPDLSNFTGKVYLKGPHYPAAHTWYAEAEMKDGKVIKVK